MASETRGRAVLVGIGVWGYPNLAATYLKNWAERDPGLKGRVDIDIVDIRDDAPLEDYARRILALDPGLVGVSCFGWNSASVFELSRRLKAARPGIRIVVGGPDVASVPEKTLAAHPEVDFVACGEGEETFRLLLRSLFLQDGAIPAVPSLAYREQGEARLTAKAELIAFDAIPPVYAADCGLPEGRALLESSRGCPFTCSFCDWGPRKMRYLPLPALERELRVLAPKARWIHLCDADLLMDQKRGLAVMEMFLDIAAGTGCTLKFDTNPLYVRKEVADLIARDPGRFYLTLGVQSVDAGVLEKTHRSADWGRIEQNLSYLWRVAPDAQLLASIIFGLPGDGLEGFRRTLDWCLRWPFDRIGASQLLVIPGSEIYREAAALGLRFDSRPPYPVLETPTMPAAEMRRARELAYHVEMLFNLRLSRSLFPVGTAPGEGIARLERWMGSLKQKGLDLSCGVDAGAPSTRMLTELANDATERLKGDPLALASILVGAGSVPDGLRAPAR